MADVGSSTADETLWLDVRAVSDFSAYRRPCPLAVWEPGNVIPRPSVPGRATASATVGGDISSELLIKGIPMVCVGGSSSA